MSERIVRVPDVGEGVAEAELVVWHVAVGDTVAADQNIADVMTDKATVEIPAPVAGVVTWCGGEPGDVLAVGSDLVRISLGGSAPAPVPEADSEPKVEQQASEPEPHRAAAPKPTPKPEAPAPTEPAPVATTPHGGPHHDVSARPTAAPAVRLRASEAGIDLRRVAGSGPAGRVTHGDLDAYLGAASVPSERSVRRPRTVVANDDVDERKLIGLRKRIAQRMSQANAHVPHISYIDEVDLTLLQSLRRSLNDAAADSGRPRLTILPFLAMAIVEAVREHPTFNARFADESSGDGEWGAGVLTIHHGVHLGIATQTPNGLLVPVVRHAETLDLFDLAREIERLASAARDGSATAAELGGSTITITSLGALGGLATTPIINRPEVAIVGVNKLQTRPVWDGLAFAPREMMNVSSSFDHRIIDGWDAAQFVQTIRTRLESPAPLLVGPSR